jgi:hypothetical protein
MPLGGTVSRHTAKTAQLDYMRGIQPYAKKFTYADLTPSGSTTFVLGRVEPGAVVDVVVIKKTDFDGTVSFDLGPNYVDSTTDDTDGIVDGVSLSSSVAQGITRPTLQDDADAYIESAADLTLTVHATHTPSAGEAMIVAYFVPFDVSTYGN